MDGIWKIKLDESLLEAFTPLHRWTEIATDEFNLLVEANTPTSPSTGESPSDEGLNGGELVYGNSTNNINNYGLITCDGTYYYLLGEGVYHDFHYTGGSYSSIPLSEIIRIDEEGNMVTIANDANQTPVTIELRVKAQQPAAQITALLPKLLK